MQHAENNKLDTRIHDKKNAEVFAYEEAPYREILSLCDRNPSLDTAIGKIALSNIQRLESQQAVENYIPAYSPEEYFNDIRGSNNSALPGHLSRSHESEYRRSVIKRANVTAREFLATHDAVPSTQNDAAFISLHEHLASLDILADRTSKANSLIPNYASLPDGYREGVEKKLCNEWLEWIQISAGKDNYRGVSTDGTNRPLLFNSVADLQLELANTAGRIPEAEVITLFRKRDFRLRCAQLQANMLVSPVFIGPDQPPEKAPSNDATEDFMSFLGSYETTPEIQEFIVSSEPGSSVKLGATRGIDSIINRLYATLAYDLDGVLTRMPPHYLRAQNSYYPTTPVEDSLRPKRFAGELRNVTIHSLPLEADVIERFLKTFNPNRMKEYELIRLLIVTADMHSSGRGKIGESMQSVAIYRTASGVGSSMKKFPKGDQDALASHLRLQSGHIARLIEAKELQKPLSAGLPSLGKR